jgi:hypothetical protein
MNAPYRRSDAEVVAGWAAEALRDGRYNLGQCLARIAMQAESHETRRREAVDVPLVGRTRDEAPVRDFYDPRTAPASLRLVDGPPGDGDADLEQARIALQLEQAHNGATMIMPSPILMSERPESLADTAIVPTPPSSARCKALVMRDNVRDDCRAVAYWSNDANRWVHVDSSLDEHHTPDIHV